MTERNPDSCEQQYMSIHTRKNTDACRDKDCIEDLRVYLSTTSQSVLDTAANARVRSAELITTYIDVEPVAFDRNHYCIDMTFFYRILADTMVGATRPTVLYGLAVFTKRAVLCGEDSRAHIYSSNSPSTGNLFQANRPTAVVEVLDPMVLCSKIKEPDSCSCDAGPVQVPEGIKALFDEPLVVAGGQRQLYVTLGQFSIVRLERDVQIVVPVTDCAIPSKECCDSPGCCSSEDPCEMFSRIPFPVQQFSSCEEKCDCDTPYTTC